MSEEHAADLRVLERFNGFAVRIGKRDWQDLTTYEIATFVRALENEYADQERFREASRRFVDEILADLDYGEG
jgi:hypothetical protein